MPGHITNFSLGVEMNYDALALSVGVVVVLVALVLAFVF